MSGGEKKVVSYMQKIYPRAASLRDMEGIKFARNEVDMMLKCNKIVQVNAIKPKVPCVNLCVNQEKLHDMTVWQNADITFESFYANIHVIPSTVPVARASETSKPRLQLPDTFI